MAPTYPPGQIIIATGWFRQLKPDQVIIISHQHVEKIKRIAKINDNQLFVQGDNPNHSTDSRSFGWIDKRSVIAKIIWPR